MKIRNIIVGVTATSTLLGGGVFGADRAINPYTDTGARLDIAKLSSLSDAGENKIELVKARPEVRFKKWNGEVDLGIRYDKIKASGNRALLTDRMEWKAPQGKEELHAYPLPAVEGMEDGGFEIEVYLTEKPATNVFEFQIDNADSLDFFYQPELTPEEIAEGADRPENVVGSYAVYHKTKVDFCTNCGTPNYATGKAFHVYRPKAIDANGAEVWAELNYANGVLSVTVPQDFLDSAVYPVRVDPTIGNTSIGGTSTTANANQVRGSNINLSATGGTLDSISAYVGDSTSNNIKGFITDSSLLIVSGSLSTATAVSTTQWYTMNAGTPPTIAAATYYPFIVVQSTSLNTIRYDTVTDGGIFDNTNSYATPTNPTDASLTTQQYSIYATYTASGGGTSPSIESDLIIFE